MIDAFYTPPQLAKAMVGALPKTFSPKTVADFAAGEGILLTSALEKWPDLRVVANDYSNTTARKLSHLYSSWEVSSSDFLSDASSGRSKYKVELGKIDLILINPPFSERGKKRLHYKNSSVEFISGTAVMFLFRALAYLSRTGYLVAVLPNSCLTSQRDEKAWALIRERYSVDLICTNHYSTFKGVSANTSLVRLHPITGKKSSPILVTKQVSESGIRIYRGSYQMHLLGKEGVKGSTPLVHTSHLKNGRVLIDLNRTCASSRVFSGPAVLFPRVGRVTPEKICVLSDNQRVVLSDCVLAVPCATTQAAIQLQSTILLNWKIYMESYCGTGAPYITVERAMKVIGLFHGMQVQASSRKHQQSFHAHFDNFNAAANSLSGAAL